MIRSIQPKVISFQDLQKRQENVKTEKPVVAANENQTSPSVPDNAIQVPFDVLEGKSDDNSKTKSEKFADVYKELCDNVPDRTTTTGEKELALSYIDRLLACDDISPELTNYWTNKKTIIQNEIQTIKNEEQIGKDTDFDALEKEFWNYSNEVWNKEVSFDNVPDRVEYWLSYYNTCISYIDRLLNCEGITDEKRAEYSSMKSAMIFDANNHKSDLNRYNSENGNKTEQFRDVINEMRANVPDSTSTIDEKQLAISYINRMLSCDDIPNPTYWENKKRIIEMEIQNIKNSENNNSGESWKDAAKELDNFREEYWYQNVILDTINFDKLSFEDAQEYLITVKRTIISFIDRVLNCSDLPADARKEYENLRVKYVDDMNSYIAESAAHKKTTNPFQKFD